MGKTISDNKIGSNMKLIEKIHNWSKDEAGLGNTSSCINLNVLQCGEGKLHSVPH